jgi:hypothetical protein
MGTTRYIMDERPAKSRRKSSGLGDAGCGTIGEMNVDPDRFAALLAARLAAIVPDGFHVTLEGDMLWFRSDQGRFPGQQGDHDAGSAGIWLQEDFLTCLEYEGTAEECAADAARHALDALQDYIAEAIHDPWPGQRAMPEPHAQVRDSALHLWYGPADDVVLACEPLPLADLPDG